MSLIIVTYAQKPAPVFTQEEVLADIDDNQYSTSRSLECASFDVQLLMSFYSDSVIYIFQLHLMI